MIYLSDCRTPTADTGYVVVSAPVTTYEGISTMNCATGYEGTAANITCTDAGTWSTQTGCTIKGNFCWHHCNYCRYKKNARTLLVNISIGHIYEVKITRHRFAPFTNL